MSVDTLPPAQTSHNGDGSQTVVFFRLNENGKQVKVTRRTTVQLEEVSTPQDRRKWRIGSEQLEDIAPKLDDPIYLRLIPKNMVSSKDDDKPERKTTQRVKCRKCQGDHLTYRCPFGDKIATTMDPDGPLVGTAQSMVNGLPPGGRRGAPPPTGLVPPPAADKYVSPGMMAQVSRVAGMMSGAIGNQQERDESSTLRVTNLPDNVSEMDLRNNFGSCGHIVRCHVAKHKTTGVSRGFAFIVFDTPQQAEMAKKRFDGMAVGSMIMHVDFSEPRPN